MMNANRILRSYLQGWLSLLKSTFAIAGWQIMILAPALFVGILFKDYLFGHRQAAVYLVSGMVLCLLIWAPLVAAAIGPFGFEKDEDWASRHKKISHNSQANGKV